MQQPHCQQQRRKVFLTLLFLFVSRFALADGGVIKFQGDSGPFHLTIFALPSILEAGPIDITALVQDKKSLEPLLDADVRFTLSLVDGDAVQEKAWLPPACAWTPSEGLTNVEALLNHGENKLLYGAVMQASRSGHWNLDIVIRRNGEEGRFSTSFFVNPPPPPALAYWRLFAILPITVTGFVLHQRARRKKRF